MRTVARQDEEPHRPSRDLPAEAAALIGAAAVLHRQTLSLITALAAGTGDGAVILELVAAGARLGENAAGLRDVAAALEDTAAGSFALSQAHAAGVSEGIGLATARARTPGRAGKGRHATQHPLMQVVRGLVPVGGLLAALKALGGALRQSPGAQHAAAAASWAGQHAAAVATGTAATGLVLTAVIVPAVTGHPARAGHDAAGGVPAPAASIWAAVPIGSEPEGAPVVVHGGADVRSSGQLPAGVPAPWFAPASLAPASPSSPVPQAGTLTVSTGEVDLGQGGGTDPLTGTVTITARGGPVTFGAVPGDDGELTVSPAAGILAAGGTATLTFTVNGPATLTGGSVTVRVWGGSAPAVTITVTWQAPPAPAASPSPSPATAVTDPSPGPVPTPDPSSS